MGFTVARQKGSHIVLRKGATGCVIPNHKEIRVGTLSGILKQAGVSLDEFLKNL
jgi:predicted RNA binding protein YcfA (HicA-like mRNA interferase family)